MLTRLYIKNFAIVDEIEMNFESGFQVITGETGAGKSILVGALGLLCGERGHTDLVRSGEDKAILEGEFDTRYNIETGKLLSKFGIDELNKSMIIRREIHRKGASRVFINDSPTTINNLSEISKSLIDLHGQHQHQRLIHPETHINYLDAYGKIEPLLTKYHKAYENYNNLENNYISLLELKKTHNEKQNLFSFQLDELRNANLQINELDELISDRKVLENYELLHDITNTIDNLLYSSEDSALIKIIESIKKIRQISDIDNEFQNYCQSLESVRVTIEEIGRFCEEYFSKIEFDPQRLEEIRNRENQIEWLFKKYKLNSISDLIKYKDDIQKQLELINNYDEEIEKLKKDLESSRLVVQKLALDISEVRKEISQKFKTELENIFNSVGLKNAKFEARITWKEDQNGLAIIDEKRYSCSEYGLDNVEFYVGINVGEPVRPLHKVASGGEISRIMLCIKSLLAQSDKISTLVFDEIDIGISGRIAQIVGKRMHQIARNHQLISITHLPQIASQADTHFAVYKDEYKGRTRVEVKKLVTEERITDIAKLLGGEKITEQVIANAEELLSLAKDF